MSMGIINVSGAGTYTLVAGVPGTIIVVQYVSFQCNILTTATFKSNTTALTGPMSFALNGGLVLPFNGSIEYFRTDVGEDLNVTLSGLTGQMGGQLYYVQV